MRADMHKYAPAVRQMLHFWDVEDPIEAISSQGTRIIEFHNEHLDMPGVQAARDTGLELQFYCPDWEPDRLRSVMQDWRFDYVNIDHVREVATLRRALQN